MLFPHVNRAKSNSLTMSRDLPASHYKENKKNVDSLRKKAAQGNADAQYNLGDMYFHGEGVPADKAKAAQWFRKAATQGHVEAQYYLGIAYDSGRGVPEDKAKAAQWFRKSAEQGMRRLNTILVSCIATAMASSRTGRNP